MKRSILIFILLCCYPLTSFTKAGEEAPPFKVLTYDLNGVIHGGGVELMENIFEKAKAESFDAILIQMDTPGGLLDSTEDIVKLFLNSDIPVIVYVGPRGARAGSAGTFITMAAHVAAMAPGTYIGAAHPVSIMGGGSDDKEQAKVMKQKIESATTSFIEAIAKQRNRNKDWAKKAVLESESITEDVALKKRVIDLVANDKQDLLAKINGRKIKLTQSTVVLKTKNATLVEFIPSSSLKFLNSLASPGLMYILLLGLLAGIYLEVTNPGAILPGVIAAICLVFLLVASRTLPVNFLGVLLIVGALALMIAEIFVTSYGLLTVAALASFFVGSLILFDPADPTQSGIQVPFSYIIGATLALGTIAAIVGFGVIRSTFKPQLAGRKHLIGQTGEVTAMIKPNHPGKVFAHSEYWNAVSDTELKKGSKVIIQEINGLTLKVTASS